MALGVGLHRQDSVHKRGFEFTGLHSSCLDGWLAIVRSDDFPQVVVQPGDCLSGYELQREMQGRTRKGQLRPKSWRPFAVNETKANGIVVGNSSKIQTTMD